MKLNKAFGNVMVIIFLFSLIKAANAQDAVLYSGKTPSTINIRAEPSTDSRILYSGNDGESIKILGKTEREDGGWFNVELPSGIRGWVRGDLIKFLTQNRSGAKLSCNEAITNVISKLETGRDLKVTHQNISKHYYTDYPLGRPESISLGMTGGATTSVLSSRILMTNLATEIVQSCSSFGIVRFGRRGTDHVVTFGLLANGRVELFVCIDEEVARRGYKLRWGENICL